MEVIKTSACAKSILLGEHAVVYGIPAIAIPVSGLRSYVEITEDTTLSGNIWIDAVNLQYAGFLKDFTLDHPIRKSVQIFYEALNKNLARNISIRLYSEISIASGLGSGASISIALFRALAQLENIQLSNEQVSELCFEIEKIHHGTPSGIDNTVIACEQPVWFEKGHSPTLLTIYHPFNLLIAHCGISASTALAVSNVRKYREENPDEVQNIFDQIRALVVNGKQTLDQGDAITLGALMTQNHYLLRQLTISTPLLDQMVDTALQAGALGAKLSGSGMGGNIIILCASEDTTQIQRSLLEIGIRHFYQTVLNPSEKTKDHIE